MESALIRRIAEAVRAGVEARSKYYASIDVEDEQQLGPPASEEIVAKLEQKIGMGLPPSYKAFLALHNGWHMVDAVTHLLPVEEMLSGRRAEKIRAWQQAALESGLQVKGKGLVIGYSDFTQSRIILDPLQQTDGGEWKLFETYKDEEEEYDSFIAWLEFTVGQHLRLAANPTGDDEEAPPPDDDEEAPPPDDEDEE